MRLSPVQISALLLVIVSSQLSLARALAQESDQQPSMLVTWFGPGGIPLPEGQDWKLQAFNVYDGGRRPVAQYHKGTSLTVSYILFENLSGNPIAKGCRDDVIAPIIQQNAKAISRRIDGETKNKAGETQATTSFLVEVAPGHHQWNLFGFAGSAKTCAEIHISTMLETPAEEDEAKAVLADFRADLNYQPTAPDLFWPGSELFKDSPALAVPYLNATLNAIPNGDRFVTVRRVTSDLLVMALGMSGDMKQSRVVAEKAISIDPDYPINYYNLACIDAEQGDAANAKTHLKQAFDRRANVLQGESMPDPTKDESILKLRDNAEFWAFVQSLPK
jgi:tetratricopeptide (TPR) repeat protein